MDPITTAIVTALLAGAASGTTEAGKKAIIDAYEGLKGLFKKKYGQDSELVKAVNHLEDEPESKPLQAGLQKELESVTASKDFEVLETAQALLSALNQSQEKLDNIQQAHTMIGNIQGKNINVTQHISSSDK